MSLTALSLNACQTFNGLKQDLSTFGKAVGNTASNVGNSVGNAKQSTVNVVTGSNDASTQVTTNNNTQQLTTAEFVAIDGDTCPPISVDPQLSSMSEFFNMKKPSAGSEVSTIDLLETKTTCQVDGEYLEVKIELSFAGALGPKAKRKDGDRPFFAYPYFIAVTDDRGNELAKETFAASVTYKADQEEIGLIETIRQRLPLNDDGSMPPYRIKVGFQLTEEQLFYNASR
jgi:predicted small secreted protein